MKPIADNLFQIEGFPPHSINMYLMGGVLIDAGTRFSAGRILKQLAGRTVSAHALTHAHPDHQGASHRVATELDLPLWCGEADAAAAEDPRLIRTRMPKHPINYLLEWFATGPAHPVARRLKEGDDVGGFEVIETPGHTVGHLSFWRESDRALVLGDVVANLNFLTGLPGLRWPPNMWTIDPHRNRESARRVAALRPEVVCFGHGPPLRDPDRFARFVETGRA